MKTKINNLGEGFEIFKNKNYNLINIDKQKCIKNSKAIIIFFVLIIFILCLILEIYKIKYFKKEIKNLDRINISLNHEIGLLFSYINNIKNESCIYQLLKPKDVKDKKKVRIGKKGDGGYVLLNDFKNIKFAYSFGIDGEISFDKELSEKNIDIFMYDHTIDNICESNSKFHWKKIGLTGKKEINTNLKTIKELIKENGHIQEKDMILKMDIEGYEWETFLYMSFDILRQFKYILVEFHFFDGCKSIYSKILKKLNKNHQIFHLHCNNCGKLINFDGYNICDSLEVSYVIREGNTFIKYNENNSINDIYYKNCDYRPDYNHWLKIYQTL